MMLVRGLLMITAVVVGIRVAGALVAPLVGPLLVTSLLVCGLVVILSGFRR